MEIKDYSVTRDNVLIALYNEDHLNLMSKKVKTTSGGIILFDFDYYVDETSRKLKMSKEIGEVISVGPLCEFCKPGDLAIIDYTVDMDEDIILHETADAKYVAIPEKHVVTQSDHGTFNANGQYCKIYDKGDCILQSNIYGVIRDEKILCNKDYVIFSFKDADDNFELMQNGFWIIKRDKECDLITLTVEFAHADSPLKPGNRVKVYTNYVFTKNIQCNAFLMAYEQDIYCVL